MSRIGKNPVTIPQGVECTVAGDVVIAKGKLGQLEAPIHPEVSVEIKDGKVIVTPKSNTKTARSLWGTTRALIGNCVEGVSNGFTRKLEINGVGYRAAVKGKEVNLKLGFSHDINFPIPEGITVKAEGNTLIISGASKEKVGQYAAEIRAFRPPEPYKGKGVKFAEEYILRKEGKKK